MTRLLEFAAQTFGGLITRRVRLKSDTIPYLCRGCPPPQNHQCRPDGGLGVCQAAQSGGWPTHLQIEPSAFCNLKCSRVREFRFEASPGVDGLRHLHENSG